MGIPSYQTHLRKKYARQQHTWLLPTFPSTHVCAHLYVDLNGIVHTCAQRVYQRYEDSHQTDTCSFQHKEDQLALDNADDALTRALYPTIFAMVLREVQALIDHAQPTALVYLALDGVAPRAKMEQQRQRRFRAVQDKHLERTVYHRHKRPYIRGRLWDSNCVTPGTTFMAALGTALHAGIAHLTSPRAGEGFVVILSDATEPGEGEHKIMTHLRAAGDPAAGVEGVQGDRDGDSDSDRETTNAAKIGGETGSLRVHPTHVLYGQDADLVMLGLTYVAAHPSASFFLLRDRDRRPRAEEKVGGAGRMEETGVIADDPPATTPLQYFRIDTLLLCIVRHLESHGDVYPRDEYPSVIRDYVALCFLLGNDFLPHSPSLAIQDKGVDVLFEAYVPLRKALGRYLTREKKKASSPDRSSRDALSTPTSGETHIDHVFLTQLLQRLAQQEDYLAGRIHSHTLQKRKRALQQQRYPTDPDAFAPPSGYQHPNAHRHAPHSFEHEMAHLQTLPPGFWAMDDAVLAGTPGWKTRYYIEVERVRNMQDVHEMSRRYVEGLFWTLQYYCHGCWSTSWYYPFLSAPLFSNLVHFLEQPRANVNRLIRYEPAWTWTPRQQLRLVLPRASYERWVDEDEDGVAEAGTSAIPEAAAGSLLPPDVLAYRLVPFAKRFRWECGVRLPVGSVAQT